METEIADTYIAVVPAGEDRFGGHRGLGISTIAFKVTPDGRHDLLILENAFRARGGPLRHLHHAQDEWFYALEGEFVIEIGDQRVTLRPGDSVLGPRMPSQDPALWRAHGMEAVGPPLAVE